jgi:hypothetical protein
MPAFNTWPTDTLRLCPHSRTYVQIIQSSIFAKITDQTTAAQYAEAEQSLLRLCERLERQVDWTHYPALTGTYACVRDAYTLASSLLVNLRKMQSEPPPPPAPPAPPTPAPPTPSSPSLEDVVEQFEEELYLGEIKDEGDEQA